jgi:hypothetical protein
MIRLAPSSPLACIETAEAPLLLWQLRRIVVFHGSVLAGRPRRAPLRRHRCRVVPESRGLLPVARGLHVGLLRDGLPLRGYGSGPWRGEGGGARPRRCRCAPTRTRACTAAAAASRWVASCGSRRRAARRSCGPAGGVRGVRGGA